MAVKIVTDSLSDIPNDVAEKLGITVVPVYVRFGDKVYRDRVEMTTEEFYYRLTHEDALPTTTQPPPGDFLEVYNRLSKETNEILTIVLSKKLSGTYDSAMAAKDTTEKRYRIEVIDSQNVAMGLGLIVISVAKAAQEGKGLDELTTLTQRLIPKSQPVMYFDTLKYLAKGGRIGKAQGMLGSLLSVKPILTLKDGEVAPLTRVRSLAAGIEYLYQFVAGYPRIAELAVEHATNPGDADRLIERLSSLYPKERIYRSTVSPVFGTHAGPNVLSVSVLAADGK